MANTGCARLCFFMVMAAFAHSGLGSRVLDDQIGLVWLHNSADNDMIYRSTYYYDDGTSVITDWTDFPGGTADQGGPVWSTETCIKIEFQRQAPPGVVRQTVQVWCKSEDMKIDCLPNCFWRIDNTGFRVASNPYQYPVWVYGWNGP